MTTQTNPLPIREALERLLTAVQYCAIFKGKKGQEIFAAAHLALQTTEGMGWRTIESAKQEGSYIIGAKFGPDNELYWIADLHWLTTGEVAELEGMGEPDEDTECGWHDGRDDLRSPSHWMPIPAPSTNEEIKA